MAYISDFIRAYIRAFPNGYINNGNPIITAPRVTAFYDSLGNLMKANASSGYNADIAALFGDSGGVQDMSTDGCFLLRSTAVAASGANYLIDDVTDAENWARSTLYSTLLADLTSAADTSNAVILFGGTNDANAAGGITKTLYKQALLKFKEFVFADFVNIEYIVLNKIGCIGSGNDANAQAIREAQLEIIAEDSAFVEGIEYYDQPRDNSVHPTDAAFQGDMAERQAQNLFTHLRGGAGGFGALPSSASFDQFSMDVGIAHDMGDDIIVTSGCEDMFGLDVGGTVYQPTLAEKISATAFKLTFDGAGFDPENIASAKIVYGAMSGLSQSSPEVIADNMGYPLRARLLTPTLADPLLGMDYTYDMQAGLATKTLSGADVTGITDRNGNAYDSSAGYYGTYNSTRKTIVAPDDLTAYRSTTTFTGSAEHFVVIAFYCPETPGNLGVLWGLGDATSVQPTPRTSLMVDTNRDLLWYQNEASAVQNLGRAQIGWNVIALNFESAASASAYVNSDMPRTFDPRDNMVTQTRSWFLGGNFTGNAATDAPSGVEVSRLWGRNAAHGEAGDSTIAEIMEYFTDQYGL